MTIRLNPFVAAVCAACLLAACGGGGGGGGDAGGGDAGGGGGGGDGGGGTPPVQTDQFTTKGQKLVLDTALGEYCYDLDKPGEELTACTGTAWDLKVTVSPGPRGPGQPTFWTNSGESGPGNGGALGGPRDNTWADLQKILDARIDPASGQPLPDRAFLTDSVKGAFTGTNAIGSAAFEYSLNGDHKLYPNFRLFQVTLDKAAPAANNTYALQVLGYYGGPGGTTSGHVTVRLASMDNLTQHTSREIDASRGWQYLNLASGDLVSEDGDWHVAFSRYNIKLNDGNAGLGAWAGDTPAGLYDAEGNPVTDAFLATKPDSTSVLALFTGAQVGEADDYVADTAGSPLQPPMQMEGSYPNMTADFGWYTYDARTHFLTAAADRGVLIRSGEGNSYMRFRLESIVYEPADSATGKQTWTIEYDLQPASGG